MFTKIDPDLILSAYQQGLFPMAESAESPHYAFYKPQRRALLPLDAACCPKKLKKLVLTFPYNVQINQNFKAVIESCAAQRSQRPKTWINRAIMDNFITLHTLGYAHSVEIYDGVALIGGLYGLALGQVFCGESMVSMKPNASKIALIHLCARLKQGGFTMLDAQYHNPHLEQFGLYEISQSDYESQIKSAMQQDADFYLNGITERELLEAYFARPVV